MTTDGRRTRRVRRSPLATKQLEQWGWLYPRLEDALRGLEWELARNATQYARPLGQGHTWVVESQRGTGAPLIWVYFTLEDDGCVVQYIHVVEA